jgi:hypothetical protein
MENCAEIDSPVFFNENWLKKTWTTGPTPQCPPLQTVVPDMSDRFDVLRFVLENCPDNNVVYPSEGYFYFKFYSGKRLISGNIRFCDACDGVVHFGYFDEYDRTFTSHGLIENGINGEVQVDRNRVRIGFAGLSREFTIDDSWKSPEGLSLNDDENLVSGILDESGYYFHLVYNSRVNQFLFLRNLNRPLPENRSKFGYGNGIDFYVGLSSRFVFLEENGRDVLVGVHKANIESNNFYDGPFDQVPPRLELKNTLETAYPYVKKRGGIDRHGNFESLSGNRVAISPYLQYETLNEICQMSAIAIDLELNNVEVPYQGFTREAKSSFHLQMKNEGDDDH